MRGIIQLNSMWRWSGGIRFQQVCSYYHFLSFHSLWLPTLECINIFFPTYEAMGMTSPRGHSRVALPSSLTDFWTPFGEGEGPNSPLWENVTHSAMHICLYPAPLPPQMTASSPGHHKIAVGISTFTAYKFLALSSKHPSVPLLWNRVGRTDRSVCVKRIIINQVLTTSFFSSG